MTLGVLLVPALLLAGVTALAAVLARVDGRRAARVRRRRRHSPLAHELPYWSIADDGILVTIDRRYGGALALSGLDSDCRSAEDLERTTAGLHALLRVLEPGVQLQWIQQVDQDHSAALGRYEQSARRRGGCGGRLAADKLAAVASTPSLRHSELVLAYALPRTAGDIAQRLGRAPAFEPIEPAVDHADRARVRALGAQLARALTALGMRAAWLGGDGLRALVYRQLNPARALHVPAPSRRGAVPYADAQTAREQLAFAGVREESDALILDGRRMRVLTVSALPEMTVPRLIEALALRVPCGTRLQTAVEVLPPDRALGRLKRQRDQMLQLLSASDRENPEAAAQLSDLRQLIAELVEQTQRLVRVGITIVLSTADGPDAAAVLDQQTTDVEKLIASLHGAQALVEEYGQLDAWLGTLPGNALQGTRWMTCTSRNAADLLCAWQSWPGHAEPLVLLENGRNHLVGLNPFSAELVNANAFVAGSSGAGKSVFTNYMLMHLLAGGVRALIIDVGGSYRRLLSLFGGSYLTFERGADVALNLFYEPADALDDTGELDPLRLQFMLTVLESLLCDERPRLRKSERALLNWAVRTLYQDRSTAPILSDLAALLSSTSFADEENAAIARSMCRTLRYWIEGPFRGLLDRPSTLRLTTELAGFDLKGLPDEVRPTVVLILSGIIWNLVCRDRDQRKVVVFDEVWTLLSSPASAQLLEELYRTSRKYNAGILSISQAVSDFTDSDVATALVNNCDTAYILQHKHGIAEAVTTFGLNEEEAAVLEGLESRRGEYSELLVLAGRDHHLLGRVVLTPLEYWIATTYAPDLAVLADVQAAYPDEPLWAVLERCAARYPHGAPATYRSRRDRKVASEAPDRKEHHHVRA